MHSKDVTMTTSLVKPSGVKPKLSSIEAARGIAATMVVFYHAARHLKADYGIMPWAGMSQFGHAGVDFFFVLSGFIIFFVHQNDLGHRSKLLTYFERRFTRIYPLFWVSLIVGIALSLFSSTQKFKGFSAILQDATLLPFGGDVGVAWTLQHEILFYLIFASAIISRRVGIAAFTLWLAFITVSWTVGSVPSSSPVLMRLASTFNLEFFFGMLAAYIVKNHVVNKRYLLLTFGVAGFSGFALAENFGVFNGYAASAQIAYGISSMLVVIGIASANLNGLLKAPRFLTELGSASYAIYLLHLPCIGVIYKLLGAAGLLTRLPLGLLYALLSTGAVGICFVISKLVEYPLMNFVRNLISGQAQQEKEFAKRPV
jgi:exopolysaccharide production protein ExoZ